jgi:hypothetical protein
MKREMISSDFLADLVQANALLREQVAALSERLREVLDTPSDSLALAKARYVLLRIDKTNRGHVVDVARGDCA